MKRYGIAEKTWQRLQKEFKKYAQIREILIFGSRAKGNYRNGSDIDLAIVGEKIDPALIFQLKSLFNERISIPYHVDVVSLEGLEHQELKEHILRKGKLIYRQESVR